MSNEIIKHESAVDLFGISARAFNVVANIETGRILNQKIGATRYFKEGRHNYCISVDLRFDDECKNGHETFAITADIREEVNGMYREYMSGCCHDEIAAQFPELARLIKWHLMSTNGPIHYVSNTCYLAGDRDCNGRAAGEPSAFSNAIRFGNIPALHFPKDDFFKFLRANIGRVSEFQLQEIQHKKEPSGYEYAPKYSIVGFCNEWYQCPFNSKEEAAAFIDSLKKCKVEFLDVPVNFSKGKPRELAAARRAAVWPDATDDELSVSKADLTEKLKARLPALLIEFKSDMLKCGFLWPEEKGEQK